MADFEVHYIIKRVRRVTAADAAQARKLALDIVPLTDGTAQFQVVQVLPMDVPSNLHMDRDAWKPF